MIEGLICLKCCPVALCTRGEYKSAGRAGHGFFPPGTAMHCREGEGEGATTSSPGKKVLGKSFLNEELQFKN
jgi:hypothetical protein